MSALNNLVRVHRWILDEKRQKLADLEQLADKMRQDLKDLEESAEAEKGSASKSFEGTLAYPTYIAAVLERRKKIRESIVNMDQVIEAAREEVHEAFQELKKYELARNNHQLREQKKHNRREQLALDEAGVSMYRRNANSQDNS